MTVMGCTPRWEAVQAKGAKVCYAKSKICGGGTTLDGEWRNLILNDQGGRMMAVTTDGICPTLRAEAHGNEPVVLNRTETFSEQNFCEYRHSDVSATVHTNGGTCGNGGETLVVEQAYDCRNGTLNPDVSGTLQAKDNGGWSLNYINPVIESGKQPHYIVRRLLPIECGRLQGFPDGWGMVTPLGKNCSEEELDFWKGVHLTDCAIKNKKPRKKIVGGDWEAIRKWHDDLYSFAAEYKMWGNGMALPNALFFVQNAFAQIGKPAEEIKLGSLFDGSGTMPLCATMCGGTAAWASEVEPYPIAVTKSHLPKMKHLGSVTDIDGAKIEPVDIITFGSPCQDLSIAGKRAGLDGARSGLFREAIRLIREMLVATNWEYPKFVIWENVPGALSSNGGNDFETVLNELLHLSRGGTDFVIRSHGKRWGGSGDYGTVAYRTVNAQFWGVPQRRRRIYACVNTGGGSADLVLFDRKGTTWNFEPSIPESSRRRETVAGIAGECYQWHDRMVARAGKLCGGGAYTLKIRQGCDGGGKGALVQNDLSATLATGNDQTVFQRTLVLDNHPSDSRLKIREDGVCQTLTGRVSKGAGDGPIVMTETIAIQGNLIGRQFQNGPNGQGFTESEAMYTLTATDIHAVAYETRNGRNKSG